MIHKLAAVVAWALLAYIVFVTLSPIALRPQTGHVFAERFLAYAALGSAFSLAYPKRSLWVVLAVALAAILPEAAQTLIPGRHARLLDGAEKLAGGMTAIAIANASQTLARRARRERGSRNPAVPSPGRPD
jgi:VanZ family protein